MENVGLRGEIAAPNLVKICVDECEKHILKGRIYHKYAEQPEKFENLVQFLYELEKFYNQISFPEEAEVFRRFVKQKQERQQNFRDINNLRDIRNPKDLLKEKGNMATFFVYVQYRQNATWQGKLIWEEKKETMEFRSVLELIKLLDNALAAE